MEKRLENATPKCGGSDRLSITTKDSIEGERLTCDAHQAHCESLQNIYFNDCLSDHIIEEIENDLKFYEKVSLVFLLYDSDDIALQRLKIAYKTFNCSGTVAHYRLLVDWALHESSDRWQIKFLEALCIIRNNMWIKKLGFSIEEMKDRFLPQNPYTSLNINLIRKVLFIICESLSNKQLEILQRYVEDDMKNIGLIIDRYKPEFMEINMLHWMSHKYLNFAPNGASDFNIQNLVKHLKVMEEFQLADYLESVVKGFKSNEVLDNMSLNDPISVGSSQTGISTHSVVSQFQEETGPKNLLSTYCIDPNNVGLCVIINQKNFYKETDPKLRRLVFKDYLEARIGTDVDRDRLCEIFLSYGFCVKIWENLTHIEMVHAIQESVTHLMKKEHSCFVLCILSHGRKNAIYGVNSIALDMDEIQKLLHGKLCPKLLEKPKIIIVQACQGLVKQNALVSDIGTDSGALQSSSPEVSDTLVFWATVPGYAAFRDRITGSWFIRALWDELLGTCNDDILSIFVKVNAKVCNRRAAIDGELKAMTPQFMTSFRKKLFFPYHLEARKGAAKRMFERYLFDILVDQFIERMISNDFI